MDFVTAEDLLGTKYKKRTKIRRPDIDPFDEEDWGWEEVNEGKLLDKFKIGGIVKPSEKYISSSTWAGKQKYFDKIGYGIIMRIEGYTAFIQWEDGTRDSYHVSNLTPTSKNKRKIRRPDIDPFDEEDWGWEEVNESGKFNTVFDYDDEVKICDGSEYRWQAYENGGDGYGQVTEIYGDDDYGNDDGGDDFDDERHNYRVKWNNGHDNSYRIRDLETDDKILLNKKRKKIRRPDIDPYDEEDWGWEDEINESNSKRFQVGDRVKMNDESEYRDQAYRNGGNGFGDIVEIKSYIFYDYVVRWEKGEGNFYYRDQDLDPVGAKKKRIRRPDIDPFDEEDWGWEEINENVSFDEPIAFKIDSKEEYDELMDKLQEMGIKYHSGKDPLYAYDYEERYHFAVVRDRKLSLSFTNPNDTISIYNVSDLKSNRKKIRRPDLDPFDEEDWGYED